MHESGVVERPRRRRLRMRLTKNAVQNARRFGRVLTPCEDALRTELKANLAAMPSAATNAKRSPLRNRDGWDRGECATMPRLERPLAAKHSESGLLQYQLAQTRNTRTVGSNGEGQK